MDNKKKKIIAIVVAVAVAIVAIVVVAVVVNKNNKDEQKPDGVVVDQVDGQEDSANDGLEIEVDENGNIYVKDESNKDSTSGNGNASGANSGNKPNGGNSLNGGNASNGGTASNGEEVSEGEDPTNSDGGSGDNTTPTNPDKPVTTRDVKLKVLLPAIIEKSKLVVTIDGKEIVLDVLSDTEVQKPDNREAVFDLGEYAIGVDIKVQLIGDRKTFEESIVVSEGKPNEYIVINLRDNDIEILPEVIE